MSENIWTSATDTIVSIMWNFWGWMERKGKETETNTLSVCRVLGTIFYWILRRTQQKRMLYHYHSHFFFRWENKCREVKYLPRGIQLICILSIPKPWSIFLCLRAFARVISPYLRMAPSLPSFGSSLTCPAWDKRLSHRFPPLHHFMLLHSPPHHQHTFVYCLPWI